jgi:uroporphyrinogen decarboxylase
MLPAPFVHASQYLRGFEDWYMDFHLNPGLLEAIFDRILEITMVWARLGLEAVGRDVDVIMCSDDMGAQNGLQVSHEHFTRYFKPRLEKYFRQIHEMSPAPLALHSCGSVASIIDDLIECGLDILNPIQPFLPGMEAEMLKQRFGGRIVFHGGISIQKNLPFGSPEAVRQEVKTAVRTLAPGGGYIPCTAHNIQADVPIENIIALFEAYREFGRYPMV